jgi:hypothetical protein
MTALLVNEAADVTQVGQERATVVVPLPDSGAELVTFVTVPVPASVVGSQSLFPVFHTNA